MFPPIKNSDAPLVTPPDFTVGMRLAGLAAAFIQRCVQIQMTWAANAMNDLAHLSAMARQAADQIFAESFSGAAGAPLWDTPTGRRTVLSRRTRSVVLSFPDRRQPVA